MLLMPQAIDMFSFSLEELCNNISIISRQVAMPDADCCCTASRARFDMPKSLMAARSISAVGILYTITPMLHALILNLSSLIAAFDIVPKMYKLLKLAPPATVFYHTDFRRQNYK